MGEVRRADWLPNKLEALSQIVRRVDRSGADRHLLIVGRRNRKNDIEWRYSCWTDGKFAEPRMLAPAAQVSQ
jgi:hypothetical protein